MEEKIYKKVCKLCGGSFETIQPRKRCCYDCSKKAVREREKEYRQKYKKPKAEKKTLKVRKPMVKKSVAPDMRRCKECFYGVVLDSNYQICDYISITGHSRPCLPGADCTVFKAKAKGEKRPRKQFTLSGPSETEFESYVQDSIFRTEKKRRNRF